mmetsp:Transcript_28966/g.74476  ORF Transcript_28966/g.74476 Transcript_28966/m.74476 type:complete len:218 (-) Transcript_28966:23-676(-)
MREHACVRKAHLISSHTRRRTLSTRNPSPPAALSAFAFAKVSTRPTLFAAAAAAAGEGPTDGEGPAALPPLKPPSSFCTTHRPTGPVATVRSAFWLCAAAAVAAPLAPLACPPATIAFAAVAPGPEAIVASAAMYAACRSISLLGGDTFTFGRGTDFMTRPPQTVLPMSPPLAAPSTAGSHTTFCSVDPASEPAAKGTVTRGLSTAFGIAAAAWPTC